MFPNTHTLSASCYCTHGQHSVHIWLHQSPGTEGTTLDALCGDTLHPQLCEKMHARLQGGRLCIAVPVSADGPPKGILLGSSAGTLYVEPPAAVALNNDLGAARGEVGSAQG